MTDDYEVALVPVALDDDGRHRHDEADTELTRPGRPVGRRELCDMDVRNPAELEREAPPPE